MAVGANEKYWDDARSQGVLKHKLMAEYLPVFFIRTSSVGKSAAYIDGFAGRGKYADGGLGSAGLMLEFAAAQLYGRSRTKLALRLFEKDANSFDHLQSLSQTYASRRIDVVCEKGDVTDKLAQTLEPLIGMPAFLFLDPCGVGIPFELLSSSLNRTAPKTWPPTEVLLNFSLEAVRRIGGHVRSSAGNETTMALLDANLGGGWWRAHFENGVSDEAVESVVQGYKLRLAASSKMYVHSIPVRRSPRQKPIYHLVFGTRNTGGLWHFSQAAARATGQWWTTLDNLEENETLFPAHPTLEEVEASAQAALEGNLVALAQKHGRFRVGDYPTEVLGEYFGQIRETAVRGAIKSLHKKGIGTENGRGKKIEDLHFSLS